MIQRFVKTTLSITIEKSAELAVVVVVAAAVVVAVVVTVVAAIIIVVVDMTLLSQVPAVATPLTWEMTPGWSTNPMGFHGIQNKRRFSDSSASDDLFDMNSPIYSSSHTM